MKPLVLSVPAVALAALALVSLRPSSTSGAASCGPASELVAKIVQSGESVTAFGYFTHIDGLPDASLFSSPTVRTEATARFKFHLATTIDSHHAAGNILTSAAEGDLAIYHDPIGGASFDDPASFKKGTEIATQAARFHTVNNVQTPFSSTGPGRGIVSVTADFVQTDDGHFRLDGRPNRFGKKGGRARLTALAQGTLTQASPVQAFTFLGGELTEERK